MTTTRIGGLGVTVPGSGDLMHPLSAVSLPTSGVPFSQIIAEIMDDGSDTLRWWLHADQQGSTIGVTDDAGERIFEYDSLEYGTPLKYAIAFDGRASRVSSSSFNAGGPGTADDVTTITLDASYLTTNEIQYLAVRIANSATGDRGVTKINSNTARAYFLTGAQYLRVAARAELYHSHERKRFFP